MVDLARWTLPLFSFFARGLTPKEREEVLTCDLPTIEKGVRWRRGCSVLFARWVLEMGCDLNKICLRRIGGLAWERMSGDHG